VLNLEVLCQLEGGSARLTFRVNLLVGRDSQSQARR
jgi:hypothetical protein